MVLGERIAATKSKTFLLRDNFAMSSYLKRLTEYYESAGIDHLVLGGALWYSYRRMVQPLGPTCQDFTISADQQRQLLSHFRGDFLVQYTDGLSAGADSVDAPDAPWYVVACSKFVDIGESSANTRSKIRRAFKNCDARKVDAEYIAERGYDCFMSAFARYRNTKRPNVSRADFARNALKTKDYPDLWEYWAVCVGNELAGYSVNLVFGDVTTDYIALKFDPRFLKAYSSYALHFRMNEYYLRERGFSWVENGWRSISHDTNIQAFLVDHFGFRRVPTNLYVHYSSWVKAALCLPRFAKRLAGRIVPKYAALCRLDDCAMPDPKNRALAVGGRKSALRIPRQATVGSSQVA